LVARRKRGVWRIHFCGPRGYDELFSQNVKWKIWDLFGAIWSGVGWLSGPRCGFTG
jgi:hypothetical protein